jgi:hypothetical protein
MRGIKQSLRTAYEYSDPATFFQQVRDMLGDLERGVAVPPQRATGSAEQPIEERQALNAKLAEEEVAPTA